jgi:O-antigen/teichoic acid export membrane protein
LGIVLYPRVIHSSDDHEITVRSMRLTLYGGGLGAAAMALLAGPIIKAYAGDGFSGSVSTFRILLVATWFLPVSSLLAPYYIKKGAFGLASASAVMLGVISVILNWILVPRYLSQGAAFATALTCFVGFIMVCCFLRYLSHVSPLRVLVPDFKKEAEGLMRLFRSANG